jgi:hypothetical protein
MTTQDHQTQLVVSAIVAEIAARPEGASRIFSIPSLLFRLEQVKEPVSQETILSGFELLVTAGWLCEENGSYSPTELGRQGAIAGRVPRPRST